MRRSLLAIALVAFVAPARAGERAVLELMRGAGASECPDERAMSDLVATRLGYEPFAKDASLRVTVRFARDASKALRAEVQLFDAQGAPKGERVLTSARGDCDELASTTALTISILLDPRAGMAPRPAPPPAPPPPKDPPLDEAPKPPPPVQPPLEPIRGRARMGGAATVGTVPALTGSVIASIGLGRAWWSFDAEFRGDMPASANQNGYQIKASFVAGGGVACLQTDIPYLCGGAWFGALHGEVAGGTPPGQSTFHMLMGPRVGAHIPITRWLDIDGYGELLYAPTGTTLRTGTDDFWSTSSASASLGLGLLGHFP